MRRRPQRAALQGAALVFALALAAAAPAQDPPDLDRAKKLVSGSCFLCHGADGESSSELFPKLAAQHPEYVAKQLANFRSGARKSETMAAMAKELSDADCVSLGAYFGRKPATAHDVEDAELAAAGKRFYFDGDKAADVAPCAVCHGDDAAGSSLLPRLAGQHAGYLENQLRRFHARERTNDNAVMQAIAARMSDADIRAVSVYLSGVK